MASLKDVKYLVIGNSAGGIGAVEAIRELDEPGAIAVVSDEPYPAYSRPLISEYLGEKRPLERMLFRPPDFYEKNNIETLFGRKAVRLNTGEHTVELDDGQTIAWGRLLLATGGVAIAPPVGGIGLKGVFNFITLDDARAIDKFLGSGTGKVRAVVIGGGLIGMSVTEALMKRGVAITIVEMKERILNTILDEEASAMVRETLENAGVEIITGDTVSEINSYAPGEVSGVTLSGGLSITCAMVVVAIGVRPRLDLVSGTDIKVNRGILVNRRMATSCPDIYACGDAAEAYDFVYDERRLTPIWPNAYVGGRIAGFNMAGVATKYPGGTAMNSLKYFGEAIVSAGMVVPPDSSYEVLSGRHGHTYRRVVLKDGLIAGMVFSGDIEKTGIIYNLMKDRVNVSGFKEALVSEEFGLASLPEEIWRPRLSVPVAGADSSITRVEQSEEPVIDE